MPEQATFTRGVPGRLGAQGVQLVGDVLELCSTLRDQFLAGAFQFGELEALFVGVQLAGHGLEGGPVFREEVQVLGRAERRVQERDVRAS